MRKFLRLEWVSVLYLILFVLAVVTPRVITKDYFGLEQVHIEELLIFTFGMVGLVTFSLYERLMERRDAEREEALRERDKTRQELVSSYEYIGAVNRQIETLKRVANETAVSLVEEDRVRKELFQSLAASAATFVRTRQATIRIVALDQLRTVREFHADSNTPIRISNKELFRVHQEGKSHDFVHSENGADILVIPSDRKASSSRAFILAAAGPAALAQTDDTMLKVYANQAELLHLSLIHI